MAGKGESKVCQSNPVFFNGSVLYICTTHQFQVCSLSKRDKIGLESFLGIDIFFVAFSSEEADIELF